MITQPSDELLFRYVAGQLDPALRLLIDAHFDMYPETRERLTDFERFAGLTLAAERPAPMAPGSLDRALARLDSAGGADAMPPAASRPADRLSVLDAARWRWAGPGRAIANIPVAHSRLKTYAFRIAPGKAMLQHSHAADEWTLIVRGAYRDESGEYHAGAFITEDDETNHRPVAIGDCDCICIAVMSGPLAAPGLTGRVAQWMMG